jgi:hypothetical protein
MTKYITTLYKTNLEMSEWLLSVGNLVVVVWPVKMDGFDLWVKPHEDRLHSVRHRIAGVVDVVEVLAKRPVEEQSFKTAVM